LTLAEQRPISISGLEQLISKGWQRTIVSDKGRHEVFKRWKSGGCFEIERMILEGERN